MDASEVMDKLTSLPNDIAAAENAANDLRQRIKDTERNLEARQGDIVASREAKAWGANADDRKAAQALAFRLDAQCQRFIASIAGDKFDLAYAETEVNRIKNTFFAVRTMADLLSAQMMAGQSLPSQGHGLAIADRAAKYGL